MRAVPAALMRCLRTALVFAAAVAMSQAALGQTKTAFHVIRTPDRVAASTSTALPPTAPPCDATVCDQITRYTDTGIIEITEYNYYPDGTCQFADPGKWSAPNDIQPQDNGAPAGVVTFSVNEDTPPPNPYTGQTCVGGGPYQYARLHFTWKLHKNLTVVRGYGPTASFSSEWTGNLGGFEDDTFEISVPVVHPIGEWSAFQAWVFGSVSDWQQTLKCCDAGNNGDANFDFVGDCVRERVWDVPAAATIVTSFGRVKVDQRCTAPGPNVDAEWVIKPGSHYVDEIGAIGGAPSNQACLDYSYQNMYFKSQAEQDYSASPYSANTIRTAEVPGVLPNVVTLFAIRTTAFSPNYYAQTTFDASFGFGTPQIGAGLSADSRDCLEKIKNGG